MRSKIVNESEVRRWLEEGRTYDEMRQMYREKYNIETSQSMWAQYRRRQGIDPRINRTDDDLLPWVVKDEHRRLMAANMLRAEARRRKGKELNERTASLLSGWLERLSEGDLVVQYEPDTTEGWFYVPRREGVDTDLVRVPDEPDRGRRLPTE